MPPSGLKRSAARPVPLEMCIAGGHRNSHQFSNRLLEPYSSTTNASPIA
jgi:hypothetical protein